LKLQTKLVLVLLPMVVIPLAALGWIIHAHLAAANQQQLLDRVNLSLQSADRQARALVGAVRASVQVFAASSLLERYARTQDETQRYDLLQPLLLELFHSYQRANPAYYEISFLQPDGFEDTRLTSSNVPNRTEEEGTQAFFQQASQAPNDLVMAFRKNPDDGRYVLSVLRRLRLTSRQVDPAQGTKTTHGYLSITVSLHALQDLVNQIQAVNESEIALMDRSGTVFLAPVGTGIAVGQPLVSKPLLTAIENSGDIVDSPDGFFYKARPTALNLFAVARLPVAMGPYSPHQLAYNVAVITLVSMLLVAWLLRSVLKRIVLRPIGVLQQATREIGHGNLTPGIVVVGQDELGELASSVAEMGRQLQQSGEHVEYLATHDSLTGLHNRAMFRNLLELALLRAKRQQTSLALLFLDIDNFKRVNDSYGHQYGDQLLIKFAEHLERCSRDTDITARNTLSRLGGDEFLVLLESLGQPLDASRVAQRLLEAFRHEPLKVGEHQYYVSTSIGISIYPGDGEDVDELIKNADFAMYQAKDLGKNTFQFFSNVLHASATGRLEMERRLRAALQEGRLFLRYQPQIDIASGRLVEAEALLRWDDGVNGIIRPNDFIPVAEETGLINDIGEWVMREAVAQRLAWSRNDMAAVQVAVNVSSVQLRRGSFDNLVAQILGEKSSAATSMTLELTETALMENATEGFRVLRAFEQMGFTLSLDDFGTGYSSLSYLHTLPINVLKIDRSFTDRLPQSEEACSIVLAIIAMAHALNVKVVAEGVETEAQLGFLRNAGCDRAQGYLIGRPMSADELSKLARSDAMMLRH
jgi:diguanylate cyclase (GGDEF)-like protein